MISIIVPTRNNSSDLHACLDSLKSQSEKPGEILVVFDSKDDGNVAVAKKMGAKAVFDKNGTIGGAYSSGVQHAKGSIVAFIDDDALAPKGWIEKINKTFKEDIDILGGDDLLPEGSSFFQRAAYQIDKARMMKNSVYGEKAKNRLRATNIAYRKNIFLKENFDPALKGLQEPEFHHRIFKKGAKMKFDPSLIVYHKRRKSLSGIFHQIYRNGKAKVSLIRLHREMVSLVDVLPFIWFLAFVTAYSLTSMGESLWLVLWIASTVAYFFLKPLAIVFTTREIEYWPHLFVIILVRETAYVLGLFAGIISGAGNILRGARR